MNLDEIFGAVLVEYGTDSKLLGHIEWKGPKNYQSLCLVQQVELIPAVKPDYTYDFRTLRFVVTEYRPHMYSKNCEHMFSFVNTKSFEDKEGALVDFLERACSLLRLS